LYIEKDINRDCIYENNHNIGRNVMEIIFRKSYRISASMLKGKKDGGLARERYCTVEAVPHLFGKSPGPIGKSARLFMLHARPH